MDENNPDAREFDAGSDEGFYRFQIFEKGRPEQNLRELCKKKGLTLETVLRKHDLQMKLFDELFSDVKAAPWCILWMCSV